MTLTIFLSFYPQIQSVFLSYRSGDFCFFLLLYNIKKIWWTYGTQKNTSNIIGWTVMFMIVAYIYLTLEYIKIHPVCNLINNVSQKVTVLPWPHGVWVTPHNYYLVYSIECMYVYRLDILCFIYCFICFGVWSKEGVFDWKSENNNLTSVGRSPSEENPLPLNLKPILLISYIVHTTYARLCWIGFW